MLLRTIFRSLCLCGLISLPVATAIEFTDEEQNFIENNPTIVVGGEMDWPPMDYVENGVYKGAAKDYLDEIASLTGIEFEVVTGYSWATLMNKVRSRELDMVPMMYWTDNRGREFNMTLPYITVRHYVFTKDSRSDIKTFDDLYGKTMAIPAGYAHIEYLQKHHPEILIKEVPGIIDAMDAVLVGDADAIIENTASMAFYTANNGVIGLGPAFPVTFEVNNVHMAVRNDWPILRDILQKALDAIPVERTTQIMAKWTGSEVTARSFLTTTAAFTPAETSYLKNKRRLIGCVNVNRMPLEFMRNNSHEGMTADYLAALGNTLKVQTNVRSYNSWQGIEAGLKNGDCDLVPLALDINAEKRGMTYTGSYIFEKLALATDDREGFFDDMRDLPAAKIGFVDGYLDIDALRSSYPAIEFVRFTNIDDALDAVAESNLFGVVDFLHTINHALQRRGDRSLKISGDFPEYERGLSLAVSDKEPLLASAVQKAVNAMPDALRTNVRRKWVAVSIEKQTDYALIFKFAIAALVLLAMLLARFMEVRRHREEIQQKNNSLREINSKLEEKTDTALHMAYHDQLTGLPNRAKLMQDLDHSIKLSCRMSTRLAVMFLDLDRFKPINDTLGHEIGDKLLQKVARLIRKQLRDTDMLCRLGGDEFVVVLEPVSDTYSPSIVAQRIIDALDHTIEIDGHSINIGSSIGIAMVPDDSIGLQNIIKCADSAMYTAKENGRNGYAYYREDMSNRAARRTQIETALRGSIRDQHFSLVFQPIVDLEKREVVKAEALIRWNHPELGFVPPDEFIPIAEEVGLIVAIGNWVLRAACKAIKEFESTGVHINAIAVNVSSVEFLKDDVVSRFKSVLQEFDVLPEQIEIEITERYMLDQAHGAEAELQKLRDLGHTLSVDDFGTGYSSLSYMKRLPLDVIKIDRSFISNIPHDQNDLAISQAIVSLSHSLGYKVVAEGVETQEQLDYLFDQCCNYAQGYFLSKPVPAEEFAGAADDIRDRLEIKTHWTAKFRTLRV